jgi:hypothetical protein
MNLFVFAPRRRKNGQKGRKNEVFRAFYLYKTRTRLYHETRKAAFRGIKRLESANGRIDFKGALWLAAE